MTLAFSSTTDLGGAPAHPTTAAAFPATVTPEQLQSWLQDGQEIALLDVREFGQYGEGHPFFAVSAPYSQLERVAPLLVPRADVRTVVFDDADSIATLAAERLRGLGYTAVAILTGGAPAWQAAGFTLFKGVNLPSKTFGEWAEHAYDTPHISATELARRQSAGEPLVLIDGRTLAEHRKMTIPGAIPIPNGELGLRLGSVVTDPDVPIVVHCAGRTRSIIGAQTLRNLGVTNPIVALENGTQGWALAGLTLEHGSTRVPPDVQPERAQRQIDAAARLLAERHDVARLTSETAQRWLEDPARTTYLIDVRTAEEFAATTLLGAVHAPGGQLVQATDHTIGVRHARVILVDNGEYDPRAAVAASWLSQLGFEAAVVADGVRAPISRATPLTDAAHRVLTQTPGDALAGDALRTYRSHAATVIDVRSSTAYRQSHPEGAVWSIRPVLVHAVPHGTARVLLIADTAATAALAAVDLRASGVNDVAWTTASHWHDAGLPTAASPDVPADGDAIDYLFFVHDRHDGNLDAARRYLDWEIGLLAQCVHGELDGFTT
ncbi:rhodanese-like domain-containing protein [Alcaligenaceae bacterium A4P071]|nr:rhodanese-like domain-containing protein [Alcaligenaceae bacterium A4P071]